MKHKISTRVIGILLTVVMLLSLVPAMSLTAYATPTCPNPHCGSTNVEPFGDVWECQDCFYIFGALSGGDEDDVSFTKVTDASQITAENIGTCTAEDAKAWILANWDDLFGDSFFADIAFYSNTGELYFVQLYSGLHEEDLSTYFDNLVDTASISNLQEWFADGHPVFICTAAAPAEDGPLVGTVIKVGDTLTLDGDYIEVMPGVIDQATDSFKLVKMEYDDYFNGWGAVFEGTGAFLIAGDETPEPDGFYVSGGNGTQSHPYTLALHYASAATAAVTFTKVTSADEITAENIGTCTAEEAKAWILANWDDVSDCYAAEIAFYSNTGEMNVVWFVLGMVEEDISNNFDYYNEIYNDTPYAISNLQSSFDLSGDSVFICTPAAPVTEWHIGDPINLGGKYYINDDQGAPSSYGFDRDVIVSEPVYETMYNQWIFENVIASNVSEAYALYISLPTGKTASDVPTGFKVKSGDGTEASPYEFELVYAEAVSFGKVTSADQITAENIGACSFADAKAWVLDNWDDIIADAGDVFAVEFAYTVNGNLRTIGFAPNITKDDFQDNITEVSCDINTLLLDYTLGGFPIYLCGFEGAATAYAGLKNTTTVVHFDSKDWYLIEDNSTSATEGTVTLLSKECVGASVFDGNATSYSGSTIETFVNNWYSDNVTADAKSAVSGGMFLLEADTANGLIEDVLKCSWDYYGDNLWWLSTPVEAGENDRYVAFVKDGVVKADGSGMSVYVELGVRPALQLDLSKVTFDSETKTFALPQPYPLWLGGVQVTNKNASNIDGNNKASYDAETNTLTLNGYTNSGTARADIQSGVNNAAIYYNDNMFSPNPLTIQLAEGTTNSLTMTGDRVYGIYVFGSALTITGNGTLNVQSEEMAINDAWGVAITGGTVYAASSGYYGINSVTIGADISSVTITGELGAIYGGSNEEQELINAVAGTGWTDTAGTTGKAYIAISTTGQNVSSYKKVYFTPHTHDFTYSADGATITATCTADGCNLTDSKVTLTIAAPDNLTYDKSAKAAVITDANAIQGTAKVQYQTKNGSTYGEATETAPTNAGTYKASITVGGATASVEYTIAKADPTYTAPTGVTATYGDTLADIALPTGWAWADNTASVGNAGTKTFKANFTPADTANYNTVNNIDVTVTVAKKEITVSGITANNKVYDGNYNATIDTSHATISGALSGDTLTVSAYASFSDKNVAEDKTVYLSNITLGGESASNYTLASSGQQETTTASITAKGVTISGITANNKVYDGTTAATINYTSATIQGMVSGDDLSIYTDSASSNFADKNVGNNKTVTISYLLLTGSDAANYTVGLVTVTANITAKEVGLEWSNTELTYNGKAHKPTATATGLAGQDTCTVTVVGEQTNAGDNYTATAQSLSNSNYKLPENKTTAFKINKASQTAPAAPTEAGKTINSITLNEIPNGEYKCGAGDWQTSPTFTGLDQNKSYVFRQRYAADANHNASAGSEETVIYTANHEHSFTYSVIGGVTITATCNGAGTCNLTDNKVSFTLTAPTSLVYDGTDKKATLEGVDAFSAATGLNVSANDIVYNYKAKSSDSAVVVTETKNAGIYQALYTLQTDFPRPVAGISFTIAKASPTYTVPTGLAATYGDTLSTVTLPTGWAWTNGAQSVGNVGSNTFTANFTPADTANYNTVSNVNVTVTVGKKAATVTANNKAKTYGEADPALTATVEGTVGTDIINYTLSRVQGENAGDYAITVTLGENPNYEVTATNGSFTINKKTVTVKADNRSKTYGDADPELTYTVEGLLEGDTLTGSLAREVGENAGTYAITQDTLAASDNYSLSFTGATMTIGTKNIKIVANDQKKDVETADPELTYTVEGLVAGDTLTGSLAREAGETVGIYAITLGTLTAGNNYVVDFTGATLTICATHIETDVNIDENAPEMNVEGINEDVANAILTEEEKRAMDEGKEVKVYLEIIAVDEKTVPTGDKAEIEKEAETSGMKVGMYLDLSLLKKIGESEAIAVHDTNGNMVKVTLTVPEELRNTNPGIKRTFYVVRVHNGETTILGESTEDTISFETDKFSTYSLVYKDVSFIWLWILIIAVVIIAACTVVFFVVKKKKKTTK